MNPRAQPPSRAGRASARVAAALGAMLAVQAVAPGATDVREAEARRVAVFERAARSVVCILVDRERSSGGSGVLIDETGLGLTNFHVVQEMLETRRGYGGLSDGRLYPLEVLGIDPGGDIAMFRLTGRERFDAAPLGDSRALHVGQWVAAMGNPFLVAEDFQPTITMGVISGLHRYQAGEGNFLEYADCIQVSTSINPGNSGGPLFDLDGRVVGINGRASFEERGRVNVGLGYAVTIEQIRRFIPSLRAGRLAEHGTFGMTVRRVGEELLVDAIAALSPAERAGIELGDVLLSVGDAAMRTPNEFNNAQAVLPADWPMTLRLRRDGQERAVRLRTERVTLRMPVAYVMDLSHNHQEVRRQFERFESAAKLRRAADAPPVAWRVALTFGDPPVRGERLWRDADDAEALIAEESAARSEWLTLCEPLLSAVQIGFGWELLGGDEVDGRVASVIERRERAGRRTRWKFSLDDDALLACAFGDDEQPERVQWLARNDGPRAAMPTSWRRIEPGAAELAVDLIQRIDAAASGASSPASQPEAASEQE